MAKMDWKDSDIEVVRFFNSELINSALKDKSGLSLSVTPEFVVGYIDYANGIYNLYDNANKFACDLRFFEIKASVNYIYTGNFGAGAGIAYYDSDKIYLSGTNVLASDNILTPPPTAKYFRLSDYNEAGNHLNTKITIEAAGIIDGQIATINDTIMEIVRRTGFPEKEISLIFVAGYIDYANGIYNYYDAANMFICDLRFFEIQSSANYIYTGNFGAAAGIAYYDSDKIYLSGTNVLASDNILTPPPTAKYFRISDFSDDGNHSTTTLSMFFRGSLINVIEKKQINCAGDSVTEGMATDGAGTADYGKSPYPAHLNTLLVDNGYNMTVRNYGHGGERTPDICARLGGIAAYITEDIVIPANNTPQSLGTAIITNGRVSGTKIKLFDADADGEDYNVFFTQTQTDTNPCFVDGIAYNLAINGYEMTIYKAVNDNKETTIKAGSQFFTNNNRNATVNIIYGGINDLNSLTLEKYILRNKACGQVNGGKYIIIGCSYPIWNSWSDITAPDKYAFYLRKCRESFGFHFLDLYDMFYRHAVDYALAAGYLSTLTSEQIIAVRDNMAIKVMDEAFTYDGSVNNIHLNEVGYHVIAMLLFDLLKRLNYI